MSKIYELDISFYNKIRLNPTYDKFIFTEKNKRSVVAVDNSEDGFWTEDFSNKTKGLIYLVNESFLPEDVEKEYQLNKHKYKNYKKVVSTSQDYLMDYNLRSKDLLLFNTDKKYEFDINIGLGEQKFKSTIVDALGLALNYESDLSFNGILLISPLGLEWNENLNYISKFLGPRSNKIINRNKDNYGLPFRARDSKEIEWIEKTKELKM